MGGLSFALLPVELRGFDKVDCSVDTDLVSGADSRGTCHGQNLSSKDFEQSAA
ncbi:hypothetical protein DPMN_180895 [Dreissena polymorpha]|uniref:Uncharacterized protein n=1 Tax=Dreissena polymorpha TaxID=45954 RepID=A0A9D4I4T2_DREPO|nr:hypothetical protein DPMN_180895 [Dreissena polymorpha]